MWRWFKGQSRPAKGMMIAGILFLIGIIARWDYVSREVAEAFGNLFRKPQQEQVERPGTNNAT